MPLRSRHEYAADLPHGLRTAREHRPRSSPPTYRRVRTAPGPDPPGSSRCLIKGLSHAGSSRTPLRPARRTRTIWQYWPVPALSGLLPPSPAPPGSGCPQLRLSATTGRRRRSLTSIRNTAPHGANGSCARTLPPGKTGSEVVPSSWQPTTNLSAAAPGVVIAGPGKRQWQNHRRHACWECAPGATECDPFAACGHRRSRDPARVRDGSHSGIREVAPGAFGDKRVELTYTPPPCFPLQADPCTH